MCVRNGGEAERPGAQRRVTDHLHTGLPRDCKHVILVGWGRATELGAVTEHGDLRVKVKVGVRVRVRARVSMRVRVRARARVRVSCCRQIYGLSYLVLDHVGWHPCV